MLVSHFLFHLSPSKINHPYQTAFNRALNCTFDCCSTTYHKHKLQWSVMTVHLKALSIIQLPLFEWIFINLFDMDFLVMIQALLILKIFISQEWKTEQGRGVTFNEHIWKQMTCCLQGISQSMAFKCCNHSMICWSKNNTWESPITGLINNHNGMLLSCIQPT